MIELIYPMVTLVILTFVVLFAMGIGRVRAIKGRQVSIKSFVLMEGKAQLSPRLQQMDRNFSNLLEIPVLFYLWCLVIMVLQIQDDLLLNLAWVYVGMRLIHSVIHITYNNVNHRFMVFVLSCLLLLVMWIQLLIAAS
ncbi:MAPEG family protein [Marinicella rhabdoformis]|uniref:MAPEG family protein n=1 Tax=Marinicella rhabdoformis TaxID=2580566 RepID=UPI0012AECC53|nr:MAPEG family protein [Marinicella rhabdoformis]